MCEADRQGFSGPFTVGGRRRFCVRGSSFAEGIDLPGERLIGAFVATLCLPQYTPANEELRRRVHDTLGG